MADNSLLKDVMTLVDEVVEETNIAAGFSKMLPTFGMGDTDGQRLDDVEYLPEDFRFESNDGFVSQADNSDAQALTDRLIPIRRNKSLYIKSKITVPKNYVTHVYVKWLFKASLVKCVML